MELILNDCKEKKIAIYGIGVETGRFLTENGNRLSVEGLLDGFKDRGEIYGYPIIPLSSIVSKGVSLIIVVARPGSCKVIAKRIGEFCKDNSIALFDVRGRDLLEPTHVSYDFKETDGESRKQIDERISVADVVSFDLFDTLITRKMFFYTDVFELMDIRLRERGVIIPDFARLRLYAEKELSKSYAPRLVDIYHFVLRKAGGNFVTASELAQLEWEIDSDTFVPRWDVCNVFRDAVASGKKVVVTTDSYYGKHQIEKALDHCRLQGWNNLYISCEQETSKTQSLFELVKHSYSGKKILHIGDDTLADIEKAAEHEIDAVRVYSGMDLYDSLGGLGMEDEIKTLSDRIKTGMFIADLFNSPFWFEDDERKLSVNRVSQIGFLFCAPIITDFVLWMQKKAKKQNYHQILFCARDGYLPGRLYRKVCPDDKAIYFLSSRTAAIRAGMETYSDIEYVDSMKYFGTPEEALETRFGITVDDIEKIERTGEILLKAEAQRENYKKYIEKLKLHDAGIGMFDFVAKGTTQMYLQKLFPQHIKGFYFLQPEPEFMADKGLDIEPFYSEDEKDNSCMFDNYYILETILTSPYPQMEEFDESGEPVFVKETRSEADIKAIEQAQTGITEFFEDYLRLVPESVRTENKMLDEKMLALVNRIQIKDESFMKLKVEDPFFGRMTDVKDVIG